MIGKRDDVVQPRSAAPALLREGQVGADGEHDHVAAQLVASSLNLCVWASQMLVSSEYTTLMSRVLPA